MNIAELGLTPNQPIDSLDTFKFTTLFDVLIEELCMYKGIKYDENSVSSMLSMLYSITKGKLTNLNVNDVTIGIESMMYQDEIKKISVQLIHQRLQRISIEKFQEKDEREQEQLSKHIDNSYWGRAMNLRMFHDKGGKILDENEDTLEAVMESVKLGICYYTGNEINIKDLTD